MAVPFWQPGALIQPGDLVRPTSAGTVSQEELDNPDFEDGDTGWTFDANGQAVIEEDSPTYDGTWRCRVQDTGAGSPLTGINDARLEIEPGTPLSVSCFVQCRQTPDDTSCRIFIQWYDSGLSALSRTNSFTAPTGFLRGTQANKAWTQLTVSGVAPANAAYWSVGVEFYWFPDGEWWLDAFTTDYVLQEAANPFLFRAVQASAGFTGNTEPDWPTTLSNQVVDNDVTWQAVAADNVTWEANRILVSGDTEPTWPTVVNGSVPDNTISWVLDARYVADERVPQSKLAAIAASKMFTADDDIAPFSATNNPLDWSTEQDAGFLPFGLQTYGANPITALGLYRGNLVVSNSVGTQIWQVDPDPQGMALLDAIPIGCTFPKTMRPVGNDLVFLTDLGVRNMGTVGPSINLQAGYFGKPIDQLVRPLVTASRDEHTGYEPISIYWPAQGQYWLIFADEAFVLTINDGKNGRSWSRYTFPEAIDYATVLGEELYLRAGDLVWLVSEDAQYDDEDMLAGAGGDNVEFLGVIQWPALDIGELGREKGLVGFDVVGTGEVAVSIGYDQRHLDYDPLGSWTEPYTIDDADTLPGQMIPLPVTAPSFSLRLEFSGGQAWEFTAANLYVQDARRGA